MVLPSSVLCCTAQHCTCPRRTGHVDQQNPHSLAKYLESHNQYVGQIQNINGMIDHYYGEGLPHLLQELDDVYHDVAGVVHDSLTEGSKKITEKTENMTARWQKTSEAVKTISAEKVRSIVVRKIFRYLN